MRTLGLIGGMSWESSLEYYRLINQEIRRSRGGNHSAKLVLDSFNFAEIEQAQVAGNWGKIESAVVDSALKLEKAGAEGLVICTNTIHKVADSVASKISIPLLHIVDSLSEEIVKCGYHKVGLLGTRFTMEEGFYKERLEKLSRAKVIIPADAERLTVHEVIFRELCQGQILTESQRKYIDIIEGFKKSGAQAVVLGCTELGLLVRSEQSPLPVLDTTKIHAFAAARFALGTGA